MRVDRQYNLVELAQLSFFGSSFSALARAHRRDVGTRGFQDDNITELSVRLLFSCPVSQSSIAILRGLAVCKEARVDDDDYLRLFNFFPPSLSLLLTYSSRVGLHHLRQTRCTGRLRDTGSIVFVCSRWRQKNGGDDRRLL